MRILSITAGAAGMYCGSCFRDNALAAALIAAGHDVTLVPVYTPTRTDEPNVSDPHVLFGGISVYLKQHLAVFRQTPRWLDRLWDAPGVIRLVANRASSTDATLLGDLTVSMLEGPAGVLREEFEKLTDWVRHEPVPDVINLPNSLLVSMTAPLKEVLRRPVCCTLQGEELFLAGLLPHYRERALTLIREHVSHVDRFIAVSAFEKAFMARHLEIPDERIDVVPLGINIEGYEAHGPRGDTFRVGYFARVVPEKGLRELAEAYVALRRRVAGASMRLEAAGYLASTHEPYLRAVRGVLEAAGLEDEFTYHGELDRAEKLAFLATLDVLSVPATYDEPKGMFLLEAMASGVPVVQPRRGGFVEVLERTGGGLLVEPDASDALVDGLHAVWRDPDLGARLARQGAEGVRAHYTAEHEARRLIKIYDDVVQKARPTGVMTG